MEITVLGSGTYNPTKKQKSSSYLIKTKGKYILLDCGSGALQRLIDLNFDWKRINHIFVSHTHPDHVADLFVIIHSQVMDRKKPLKIYGPKNIKKIGDFIRGEMSSRCKPPKFVFNNITLKKIKLKNILIETETIKHDKKIPELAYKFINNKKKFVYSSDLGPSINKNKFIKFCKNSDLLIADSGSEPGKVGGDHFTPREIGEIATAASVKKLVLTHQTVKSKKAIINDCKKSYLGKIIVAQDLMKIKL